MTELMNPLAASFRHNGSNGEAVVLIHGFTGVPAHFRPLAATLHEAGYTVIVPRLAGHGTSVTDLAGTRGEDWVESARQAVIEVSDHERIHLGGLSMGGLISVLLAESVGAATVATINSPIIVRNKQFYVSPIARYFKAHIDWPETDPPDLEPGMLKYWLPYPGFPTKGAADLLAIVRRALRAARKLAIPSLVVQSRTDETVDPRSARILANLLGDRCRILWLDDSIHVAVLDHERDKITEALLEQLASP
ncbi:MAG: alpha/beta fold hydrolase [Acidimicrobiia bacterium]|nr:alpha/beta fold hydrolase [Acidimicrobiia bacterium]